MHKDISIVEENETVRYQVIVTRMSFFYVKHQKGDLNGKYIVFCAGDDYWSDENKLQIQVDFLEANPDYIA